MKLQEFESKRQEYAEISDMRYIIEKLTRVINDFRQRNPNADYDASYLEKLFLELSNFEEFNVIDFKNGVCSMAEVVLDYQKRKYEEMVTNFEK